jgi:hypothetical protein
MRMLWIQCTRPGAICLYSDTDSMFVKTADIVLDSKFIGKNIGMLEIEHIFDEFITVGKKQYMGKYGSLYKYRFKGVPQAHIKPEMYSHLLDNPSNSAQIDFLKFKREWGSVKGYIESKVVTQT